jgi:signal peptidase II
VVAFAVTAAVVLAADAVSKALVVAHLTPGRPVRVVGSVLRLDLTRNSGAAFSIGTGATIVFTAAAVVVAVVLVRTARRLVSSWWGACLGLLLGGALGNLADRLFRAPGPLRGHVVDWIRLPHWPVFNLADSAIVVGAIAIVLLAVTGIPMTAPQQEDEAV